MQVGDRVKSKSCGYYTIVEKIKGGYCKVRFDAGYETVIDSYSTVIGNVKDPLHPQVLGVGYLGVGPYVSRLGPAIKGFKQLPEYNVWINMLQRCYYDKYINRVDGLETYDDIEVCEDWHNFQNFAEWYIPRRKVLDDTCIKRPALDKDILSKFESKVYSPETCCVVPQEINSGIIGIHKETSGILQSKKGYYVMHKSKRVSEYLGTIDEAKIIRKQVKHQYLIGLVNKHKDILEEKVYDKLCNWFD